MAPMDKNVAFIRGWVDCGAHEATADIFVYNAAGDLLNEPPPVQPARVQSGSSGVFLVAARDVPKAFRVVAENVRFSGDLAAALKAEVGNFDPTQDIVHINPVTTLV